jgi:hypothetical protein
MLKGRTLVVATAHGKEKAIAPLLESRMNIRCIVPAAFPSDSLGTFTGEIERALTPLDAAREKCKMALDATGYSLAVASEGSFGPHPTIPFMPCDDELLVLMDTEHDFEIAVRELSTETNFATEDIHQLDALHTFAERVGFPSHALILRATYTDGRKETIEKGIQSEEKLHELFTAFLKQGASVRAETDMRAHFNPTRMKVIEKAALRLVERMESECPKCTTPGFGIVRYLPGLPCGFCGMPTASSMYAEKGCVKCDYSEREAFPHGKQEEDPMYCAFCNP